MDIIIRIIQTRCFSAKRIQPILGDDAAAGHSIAKTITYGRAGSLP